METPHTARKQTRREQEQQLRRQEILQAARALFVEKGFRNTTLDEIAERSAFGKGTIYNYFANKDELFHAIIFRLIDETLDEIRAAMRGAAGDARSQLRAYAQASVAHFHANNEVFIMIMREHNQLPPEVVTQFVDRFQDKLALISAPLAAGMQAGTLRAVDPSRVAVLFDGMIRTYCLASNQGLWPDDDRSPAQTAELIVSLFFNGLENQPNQE